MQDNLLTIQEAMDTLRISKSTIRKLIREGSLKAVRIGTRGDYRFTNDEIERFIKENTQ